MASKSPDPVTEWVSVMAAYPDQPLDEIKQGEWNYLRELIEAEYSRRERALREKTKKYGDSRYDLGFSEGDDWGRYQLLKELKEATDDMGSYPDGRTRVIDAKLIDDFIAAKRQTLEKET